ncbi:hypothetical protein RA27_07790 [Ruegeria sp. ANG-R]|nr:hypothetical protein RA27_07790 [Ruegeria sp. ANG-R]
MLRASKADYGASVYRKIFAEPFGLACKLLQIYWIFVVMGGKSEIFANLQIHPCKSVVANRIKAGT